MFTCLSLANHVVKINVKLCFIQQQFIKINVIRDELWTTFDRLLDMRHQYFPMAQTIKYRLIKISFLTFNGPKHFKLIVAIHTNTFKLYV